MFDDRRPTERPGPACQRGRRRQLLLLPPPLFFQHVAHFAPNDTVPAIERSAVKRREGPLSRLESGPLPLSRAGSLRK